MNCLTLKKSNCKNCYKCIRNCPVKAIRFSGNQAHIIGNECILCGQCFVVCPQNAKEIVNETEKAKERLLAIKNNNDGFKISELDYDMRGSGDFLGERQSGKFISELGALKYSSSVIFFAKTLSDEAFNDTANIPLLKKMAKARYEELKNVTLN